jgi:tRNA-dihydrouridine synthase 2
MIMRHVVRMQAVFRRSLSTMNSPIPAGEAALPTSIPSPPTPKVVSAAAARSSAPYVPIPRHGVDYRGKIVLAPMVRSGELPSRLLALHYGADLVWGPETVDKSMIGTTERTNPRTGCKEWTRVSSNTQSANWQPGGKENVIFRIDPAREKDKFIYQIGTASPTLAVQAASLVAPYCSGIDVNAGCPKPFSTSGGMGAQLLRTPDLLCDILRALVAEVGTPHEIGISVKIRLLETPELTSELVNKLCKTGITGLTIHCRTTPMRPRERAIREQLRMIADICRAHGVACLMNGDVTSREEGLALAEEFNVDGAMIATAAESNSSVFRTKEQGGLAPWREVVEEYLRLAFSVENKFGNTKFLLSQLMPGKHKAYQQVTMAKTNVGILEVLEIQDEDLVRAAKAVDSVLGLDQPRVSKKEIKKLRRQENDQRQATKLEKRALNESTNSGENQHKRQKQKAESVAEDTGFEGVGSGGMAVAV